MTNSLRDFLDDQLIQITQEISIRTNQSCINTSKDQVEMHNKLSQFFDLENKKLTASNFQYNPSIIPKGQSVNDPIKIGSTLMNIRKDHILQSENCESNIFPPNLSRNI
jgi:hypothetical protein